jgi:hypothetical protein
MILAFKMAPSWFSSFRAIPNKLAELSFEQLHGREE